MYSGKRTPLDPTLRCADAVEFEGELRSQIIGQEEAIGKVTEIVQKFMAGLNDPSRTVGNVLLLGPTGTGKTHLVEAVCDVLFRNPKGMIKIDCGEFKLSHEIAKLIGAPPGYIGHESASPRITQEKLDKTHNKEVQLSVLLFDEIEKAHETFWDLLLGIFDKGTLTDNKGVVIDLTKTLVFMTSNLGAREVIREMDDQIGFTAVEDLSNDRINSISTEAANKRFNPEFMNRLDQVITFKHLTQESLSNILNLELGHIQKRILLSKQYNKFVFTCSSEAKNHLLSKGVSKRYGARYLKRALEQHLVTPLVNFILTAQVDLGDLVEITLTNNQMQFHKIPSITVEESQNDEWKDFRKASDDYSGQDA